MKNSRNQNLSCKIEGEQIVIRAGVSALKRAAETCPRLVGMGGCDYEDAVIVSDQMQLAEDICKELTRKDDGGVTAIHELLWQGFVDAMHRGSKAVGYKKRGGK